MLSAILIGNNIVNLSASSVATTFAISLWGNKAVGIATGVLTFVVLMFGEIIPKTWAMQRAEFISLMFSPLIRLLMTVLTPIIFLVDMLSNWILKLLHISSEGNNFSITEKELKTYVDVSHEGGVIESEERTLIYNVFDFGDTVAKDIMIPRIQMTTVPLSATYQELLSTFQSCMCSGEVKMGSACSPVSLRSRQGTIFVSLGNCTGFPAFNCSISSGAISEGGIVGTTTMDFSKSSITFT